MLKRSRRNCTTFRTKENQLTNIGYIYMDQHKFGLAEASFQQALALAKGINSKRTGLQRIEGPGATGVVAG